MCLNQVQSKLKYRHLISSFQFLKIFLTVESIKFGKIAIQNICYHDDDDVGGDSDDAAVDMQTK